MWFLLLSIALAQDRPEQPFERLSADYPIRVHWERPGDERLADRVLDALELSWRVQVDELGFRAPVLPDGPDGGRHGPELDAYLIPLGASQAWASPDDFTDSDPTDGYSATPAYMAIDWNLPEEVIDPFVAHEFNHVLQYATDYNEWTLTIWEATAASAQSWTLGEAGAWDADVADFQADPYLNTLAGDSYYAWYELDTGYFYEYGAALWMMHLDQVVGEGDGRMGPALWEAVAQEGLPNEPDVLEAFATVSGKPLGAALNDLARTRFLVADDWDDRGLTEAAAWPLEAKVPAAELHTDGLSAVHAFAPALMPTGMGFVDLTVGPTPQQRDPHLIVEASSLSGLHSGVIALWWASDGTVGEVQAHGELAFVELPLTGVERVAIAVTNLEHPDYDGDRFLYRAGDQELYLALGDGPGTHAPGGASPGCGCHTQGPFPAGLAVIALLPLIARRRR